MYDTQEEAQQKLVGCVVLFEDKPTYITSAAGSKDKVSLNHLVLRTSEKKMTPISDPGFEFRNLGSRIGYVNFNLQTYKEAVYLTRAAVRKSQQTQGLSQYNMRIPTLRGSEILGTPKANITWGNIYNMPEIIDMLEKKYPTLEEVRDTLVADDTISSKAFSRQLAISKPKVGPFYLEYRGKNIGYTEDFFKWRVGCDYDYLFEMLEMFNLKVA